MTFSEEKHKLSTSYLLPFEKMHGLGNDFVVVNASHLPEDSNPDYERNLAIKICDRHRGIGADGLIIIAAPINSSEVIRSWRFYNSDGTIPEMCGNGIRCAAKYIYEHGLSGEDASFKIETLAGDIGVEMLEDEMVRVDMGAPRSIEMNQSLNVDKSLFEKLPDARHVSTEKPELTMPSMRISKDSHNDADGTLRTGSGFTFEYDAVSMGNPHAIGFFDNIESVKQYGPEIEVHSNFPNKTNVEFAHLASKAVIDLIVWERGCGFTEACGTGACATAVSAISRGLANKDEDIQVRLPGGTLIIKWDSITDRIFMTGPAEMVFVGYFNA